MTVGLLVVSHSARLAEGVVELAAQMAPDVPIVAAGGDDDGGLGTSFERVAAGLAEADDGAGVVVLYDLGSALLTTETALELAEPEVAERVRIVDAPLVEGTVAAAVSAQQGGAPADVASAARSSSSGAASADASPQASDGDDAAPRVPPIEPPAPGAPGWQVRDVELVNELGLHARPAAELARTVAASDAHAFVGRPQEEPVDLTSVLAVVARALRGGERVRLTAAGPGAAALLETLASRISQGFGELAAAPTPSAAPASRGADGLVRATAGADGLALGPAHRLRGFPERLPARRVRATDTVAEAQQLTQAVDAAAARLDRGDPVSRAHAAIVRDPQLLAAATSDLAAGAPRAWWDAVQQLAGRLESATDEVVAARAVDVRDAGAAVLEQLGVHLARVTDAVEGTVVLADDLGPAQVPALIEHGCVAAVLARGAPNAHAVIVARALGLPLVIRSDTQLDDVAAGTLLGVDGAAGTVLVDPDPGQVEQHRARLREQQAHDEEQRAAATEPVVVDGRRVLVAANIGSAADAREAVRCGADAVGLLRTELLLLEHETLPGEDQQVDDLRAVLDELGGRPVVVRVLDVGGDKPVTALDLDPVHHGFLGLRGLRYLLENPDLLHTQLRAICRASVDSPVSVMAPMVTTVEEARAFRDAVETAVGSLRDEGVPHAEPVSLGVMVEIPAAALTVDQFAGVADFVSIGSNDLLSYTVAAERTEPSVAHLLDDHTPALSRLLDRIITDAEQVHVPVAVCGELAGHPGHAVRLVEQGVGELSMSPRRIPAIKAALRELDRSVAPSDERVDPGVP